MFCKQNPAKVHLTQIVGDKMQKVDLCEECAKAEGRQRSRRIFAG